MAVKLFKSIDEMTQLLGRVADSSPVYQRIALYIEKNYLQVVFMTANELADAMGVSQGSVSRFFIALGYHGYNEFLRNLQQIASRPLRNPQSADIVELPLDDPRMEILEREIDNIRQLGEISQSKEYEELVQIVLSGKRIVLLSAELSGAILTYLEYVLKKIGVDVISVTPATPNWEWIEFSNPEKLHILAVGFPSYPTVLIKKCQSLKRAGFPLFAITDSRFSPLVKHTDQAIFVPVTMESPFDGCSTPSVFFSLLLRDIAVRMPNFAERLDAIHAQERKHKTYFTK